MKGRIYAELSQLERRELAKLVGRWLNIKVDEHSIAFVSDSSLMRLCNILGSRTCPCGICCLLRKVLCRCVI